MDSLSHLSGRSSQLKQRITPSVLKGKTIPQESDDVIEEIKNAMQANSNLSEDAKSYLKQILRNNSARKGPDVAKSYRTIPLKESPMVRDQGRSLPSLLKRTETHSMREFTTVQGGLRDQVTEYQGFNKG